MKNEYSMTLSELKEQILELYDDYDIIDKSLMEELKKIFPLTLPNGINEYDAYLLLLNNDFNISVEEIIHLLKQKQKDDREITEMLF